MTNVAHMSTNDLREEKFTLRLDQDGCRRLAIIANDIHLAILIERSNLNQLIIDAIDEELARREEEDHAQH